MGLDTQPSYVTAAGAVFLALCPIVVALRFFARLRQRAGLGVDDWLTIPALLMVIGCAVNVIVGVCSKVYAYPTPKDASRSSSIGQAQKLSWSFQMMQILSIGFTKLSFVFFFRRIFVDGRFLGKAYKAFVVTATIVSLWTAAFFLWTLFTCGTHFSDRWTMRPGTSSHCPPDYYVNNMALTVSDMLTDLMVLCLPIPSVLRLRMKTSRKLAVLAVFGLGFLSLAASVVRLATFVNFSKGGISSAAGRSIDVQLLITQGSYWPLLEAGLALIACCLPLLHSLFKRQSHQPASSETHRVSSTPVQARLSSGKS